MAWSLESRCELYVEGTLEYDPLISRKQTWNSKKSVKDDPGPWQSPGRSRWRASDMRPSQPKQSLTRPKQLLWSDAEKSHFFRLQLCKTEPEVSLT